MSKFQALYPLSPMQEGMLYHTLSEPAAGMYLNQLAWRLGLPPGVADLDLDRFREAWARAVRANGVLRTALVWKGVEQPIQVVFREMELPFRFVDLRERTPESRAEWLETDAAGIRLRGFDLARAPLFDLRVARTDDDAYHFLFSFHHILLDGWSVVLLLDEVMSTYVALATGREPRPIPRRPFRDYIVWLSRVGQEDAERFWRREVEAIPGPSKLALARPAGPRADHEPRSGVLRRRLSPPATEALRGFARSRQVTLLTLIQAAWGVTLSRYSGSATEVIGSVTLGRPSSLEGSEEMIGLFVNTLPVRVDTRTEVGIDAWLRELQARQAEARRFESCPLRQIQEWGGVAPGSSLFETLVVSSGYATRAAASGSATDGGVPLQVELIESSDRSSYPVVVEVSGDESMTLTMSYDRARLDSATAARLLKHLESALDATIRVASPREISVLTDEERHQLLVDWSVDAGGPQPTEETLREAFDTQVAVRGEAVALVAGETHLSYAASARCIDTFAARLLDAGVEPGDVVGVALPRSEHVPIAWLAAASIGAAYLPIDPTHPAERLARIFETARPRVVVAAADRPAALSGVAAAGAVEVIEPESVAEAARARAVPVAVPVGERVWAESMAHLVFTSGSTGVPKGSMNNHRGILQYARAAAYTCEYWDGERALLRTPATFDPAIGEMAAMLLLGRCLVVAPPEADHDLVLLGREIARQRASMQIVPSLLRVMLDQVDPRDLAGVRRIGCGGEEFHGDLVRRIRALLPEVRLYNHYGPTEATVDATVWDAGGPEEAELPPIGRPLAGARILVLDREMRLIPVGATGEIFLGGTGLAHGYLGRPTETALRFVPDPFADAASSDRPPGGRLYRTGDLGRWRPTGEVVYLGRLDHQVKLRGVRIELGEIEAIAREHPAVRDVVAMVRRDPGDSPDSGTIVAYLAADEVDPAIARDRKADLEAHFAAHLPSHSRPTTQVWLESFPRLPSRKVDRGALARLGPEAAVKRTIAPRDDFERRLVDIWSTVLRRSPLSIDDDFFELGGHSLLAFRLMAKVNQEFGVTLPMSALLTGPATPQRLAVELRNRTVDLGWTPLVRLKEGSRTPFFCVHPIGGQIFGFRDLAESLAPDQPFFGLQAPGLEEYREASDLTVSIEDMAAHYVRAVRSEVPEGPYFLGGMSFGAAVAFEMAQQLRRAGQTVGLVALLDSPAPLRSAGIDGEDYSGVIAVACHEFAHQMGGSIELTVEDLRGRERDDQLSHVLGLLRAERLVSSEIDVPMMRRLVDGHQARLSAILRYQGGRYPGTLHLFRAVGRHGEIMADLPEDLLEVFEDPELGWGAYTEENVVVHEFDAFHETLLAEPAVREVAARLQCLIDGFASARPSETSMVTTTGDRA